MSLNADSFTSRQRGDSRKSSLVVRVLVVVLRCFIGALAVLYAANMAAILTADRLLADDCLSLADHDDDDVISTVSGSDVSRLLTDAETPRQRQLWDVMATRRSVPDYDHDRLVDDADVGFSRLMTDELSAFVWHSAGLQYRAVLHWGCGWRSARVMATEDVGLLTFGIALSRAVGEEQSRTRQLLNGALLELERENFFETLHNK